MKVNPKNVLVVIGGIVASSAIPFLAEKMMNNLPHYDKDGFDRNGFDREGYNRNGFNSLGFDRNGYDAEGFDKNGYSPDGYDRDGRDHRGYDRNGFSKDGFDRYGYDADGFSRSGYSVDGFDREGYDRQGYGRNFYNSSGIDRAGRNSMQYYDLLGRLHVRLNDAKHQLDLGTFRYAINDARLVMDEAIRLVVEHAGGTNGSGDGLLDNLKICESKSLLPVDSLFIDRLHGVRLLCNSVTHELDASDQLTHQKTYFVLMQTRDLLKVAETTLCTT